MFSTRVVRGAHGVLAAATLVEPFPAEILNRHRRYSLIGVHPFHRIRARSRAGFDTSANPGPGTNTRPHSDTDFAVNLVNRQSGSGDQSEPGAIQRSADYRHQRLPETVRTHGSTIKCCAKRVAWPLP
jgi:hypothetical protein